MITVPAIPLLSQRTPCHPFVSALIMVLSLLGTGVAQASEPSHASSMYGNVKYPAGFSHFDYVNPDAPKGGKLKLNSIGTFDSLNPWIIKGTSAAGITRIYDTLTIASLDEPFTQYGLIAEKMEIADDRSWEIFYLDPKATFADGKPITTEDVAFTFHTLVQQGSPFWGFYYKDVTQVDVLDKLRIKFSFKEGASRELPLIIGQMAILPKHYWQDRDFSKTSLDIPVGSGPYKIAEVKPGKRIVYERRDDYWAKDLPVNKGLHNFDSISYDYYQDETVALEAFKGSAYDYRQETTAQRWATGYQSPALSSGRIIKEEITHSQPAGMQAFAFNLRKPLFQDIVLRKAINLAFDFEWSNKTLFYNQYKRTNSYFQNSDMASHGLPSAKELSLLSPYRDQLPAELFRQPFTVPVTDGQGHPRAQLKAAQTLLADAGYTLQGNQLFTPDSQPVKFEFLLTNSAFERVVLPFTRNLATLGIQVTVRRIDQPQYVNRLRTFDYDMIVVVFPQSASPGSEQRMYWSSEAADSEGSQNYIGIKNDVVDALVNKLVDSQTYEQLVTRSQALDRVLLWSYYVVPNWYNNTFRLAYRNTLAHPAFGSNLYAIPLDAWWSKTATSK